MLKVSNAIDIESLLNRKYFLDSKNEKKNPEISGVKNESDSNPKRIHLFKEIDIGGFDLIISPKMKEEMKEENYFTTLNLSKLIKQEYKEICQREPSINPKMKISEKMKKFPSSCINSSKNRYKDVLSNEETTFRFLEKEDEEKGVEKTKKYINANHIKSSLKSSTNNFVATQAPLETTFSDFYEMIWQSKSNLVISLSSLIENSKVKMDKFWPSFGEVMKSEEFTVILKEEIVHKEDLLTRVLSITNEKEKTSRIFYHLHYTGWPDNDVPKNNSSLIEIYQIQQKYEKENIFSNSPVIVNCSAGIGRTATYISFVFASQIVRSHFDSPKIVDREFLNSVIDLPSIVLNIRKQRSGSVQTASQYMYIYKSINLYLKNNLY